MGRLVSVVSSWFFWNQFPYITFQLEIYKNAFGELSFLILFRYTVVLLPKLRCKNNNKKKRNKPTPLTATKTTYVQAVLEFCE